MDTPARVQTSHAQVFDVSATNHGFYETMMSTIGGVLGFFGSIPCCFCCPNPYVQVDQGQVGLVQRFGKVQQIVDPGLHGINVVTDKIRRVDLRLQVEHMPRQVVLTKDNVNVDIDAVLYWRIVDPYVSSFMVNNVRNALMERTQSVLRQIFGARTIQEAIELRETIAHEIEAIIAGPAREWGVTVDSILIKDLTLGKELLDSLSAAAKQRRIGESKVIAAEAEIQAAQLMRKAADILSSDAAMNIRYLETMAAMARTSGSKVIFMPAGGGTSGHAGAGPAAPGVAGPSSSAAAIAPPAPAAVKPDDMVRQLQVIEATTSR
jgi:erythrocyte band 7 integral membrane protein